jgi:hypothetical protein
MLDRLYDKSGFWLDRVGEIGLPDRLTGPLHTIMRIRRANLVR